MKVYILVEYCCNHFDGVFKTYDEAVKSRFNSVEEMLDAGFDVLEKHL